MSIVTKSPLLDRDRMHIPNNKNNVPNEIWPHFFCNLVWVYTGVWCKCVVFLLMISSHTVLGKAQKHSKNSRNIIPRTPDNCLGLFQANYVDIMAADVLAPGVASSSSATIFMMMSSNGNLFRVTGPLWGESIGHRWLPLTKASDVELMFCLICAWTNSWAKNRDAGDLKRHRAHYDLTMTWLCDMGMYNFLQSVSNSSFYKHMGNVLIYGHNDNNKILTYTYICNICIWLASINVVTGAVLISMINFSMNTEAQ